MPGTRRMLGLTVRKTMFEVDVVTGICLLDAILRSTTTSGSSIVQLQKDMKAASIGKARR